MAISAKLIAAGGAVHPLAQTTRVGRSRDADLVLDDKRVSRAHAAIRVDGPQVVVEDLGSTNGTWVNGVRIKTPTVLSHGDEVRFHRHTFHMELRCEVGTVIAANSKSGKTPAGRTPQPRRRAQTSSENGSSARVVPTDGPAVGRGTAHLSMARSNEPKRSDGQAYLTVAEGLGSRVVELSPKQGSARWTIGRHEACDLVLADAGVSGRHVQLEYELGRWRLVNLVSANGTLVNGEKTLTTYLSDQDQISIGLAKIVFRSASAAVGEPVSRDDPRSKTRRLLMGLPAKVFLGVGVGVGLLVIAEWLLDFGFIVQMGRAVLLHVADVLR